VLDFIQLHLKGVSIMDYVTILIGSMCICYGIFSAIMRVKKPELFKKLEPMKKRWGEKAGIRLHFFGYVLIPIIFGISIVISGYFGKNLFEILD
jgi:uncharacterized membrane protein